MIPPGSRSSIPPVDSNPEPDIECPLGGIRASRGSVDGIHQLRHHRLLVPTEPVRRTEPGVGSSGRLEAGP